jgi:peptide/nickel transport system substrate-binding protein
MLLAACAAPEAEVIEVTRVVEKEVEITRIVEGETIIETVVETVIETVIETVVETVIETVEVEAEATPVPVGPEGQKRGGIAVMGFYQEPELLNDLIRTQTVADIAGEFMERGLLISLPDGNWAPDLALEVPTIQNGGVSEDGMTVSYNLGEGILWSDGTPFTCTDVQFTWEAVVHPESGAVSTAGYDVIESVTCTDDYTVVVQFAEFYAPYLALFGAVVPRHATGDPADMQNWIYNRFPISLGPFKIVEWVSGDHMTLERNERYEFWESEGKPFLDAVVLQFIESREVGKQLIQTGELDFLWDLIEADLPEAEGWEGVKISNPASTGTERLLLNLADPEMDAPCSDILWDNAHPHWALGDPLVREAIEVGIDKQLIVEALLYGYAPVGTREMNLGWAKPEIPASEYDPERAMELLEEAGWTDADGDGVRECNGCPYAEEGKALKLKIQTTSGNALREQAEQVIMEMMAEIGIEFYIENVPSSELFGSYSSGAFRKHGQYDILMYTTSYGTDPHSHMLGYFGSESIPCDDNSGKGFNYSRWVDAEADAALEIAGASPDLAVRAEAYQILAERIAAGRPHIYLYDRADIDLLAEDFMGYDMNIWESVSWNCAEWWLDR